MRNLAAGFTLTELIITMALLAILLTVAIPAFTDIIYNNRLASQVNEFVRSLNQARSEAIKRGVKVTVCKSSNGKGCTSSGGWEQGWITFVDNDGDAQKDSGEDILHIHGDLAGNTLRGNGNVKDYISFNASGFTELANGGFQAGTLVLCDSRGFSHGRAIIINAVGRIRIANASDSGLSSCTP